MFYAALAPAKERLVAEKSSFSFSDSEHRRTIHSRSRPQPKYCREQHQRVQYLDWWYYRKIR